MLSCEFHASKFIIRRKHIRAEVVLARSSAESLLLLLSLISCTGQEMMQRTQVQAVAVQVHPYESGVTFRCFDQQIAEVTKRASKSAVL